MKKIICLLLLSISCATPSIPYTTEYRIDNWKMDWISDGPAASKVLVVRNPSSFPIYAVVRCESNYEVMGKQVFHLQAHSEERMILQVMNRDILFDCCVVESWGKEK